MSDTDNSTDQGTTDDTSGDQGTTDQGTDWSAFTAELEAEGLKPGQVTERLKASRKWEERAKANAKAADELEKLQRERMSDTDKAVDEARAAARKEAAAEFGQRLAAAEVKAALAGIVDDPATIVEDLNLARFVTDDGEVDADAVKAFAKKYGEKAPGKGSADLKQGARGSTSSDKPDNNQWLRDKVAASHR